MSSEYTFLCVRGTRFSNFFSVSFSSEFTFMFQRCTVYTFHQVSFTSEFTSRVSEVHGLVVSSGFHSPVSVLSLLSKVHSLLLSLGFHSPGNSLFRVSEMHILVVS